MTDEVKPKSKEHWEHYKSYTTDVTETSRKLGFASVAICWIFKTGNTPETFFPGAISAALVFVVGYFLCDLLQYLVAALSLRFWLYHKEKKQWKKTEYTTIDFNEDKPRWIDRTPFLLFSIKIVLLIVGYLHIAKYLLSKNGPLEFI